MGYGTYTWVVQEIFRIFRRTLYWDYSPGITIPFKPMATARSILNLPNGKCRGRRDTALFCSTLNFGPYYPERTHDADTPDGSLVGVSTHSFFGPIASSSGTVIPAKVSTLITSLLPGFDLDNPPRVKNENGISSDPIIIPAPGETTNARINFWIMTWISAGPSDGLEHEVVIRSFSYQAE